MRRIALVLGLVALASCSSPKVTTSPSDAFATVDKDVQVQGAACDGATSGLPATVTPQNRAAVYGALRSAAETCHGAALRLGQTSFPDSVGVKARDDLNAATMACSTAYAMKAEALEKMAASLNGPGDLAAAYDAKSGVEQAQQATATCAVNYGAAAHAAGFTPAFGSPAHAAPR